MKAALTPLGALTLGGLTGFFYRDELYFPTNMRLKMAVIEYHLLTRQQLNTDLLDILEPSTAKEIASRG